MTTKSPKGKVMLDDTELTQGNVTLTAEMNAPHIQQFIANIHDNLAPLIRKATVPLFVIQDKKVKPAYTGVFLRVADKHFLLTASHNWREINALGLPVLAGWDDEAKRPVSLPGVDMHLGDPNTYDVAILTLPPDCVATLKKRFDPIFVRQMRPRDDDKHGFYLLCGCPQDPTLVVGDKTIATPYLTYMCQKYEGERGHPSDGFQFDPRMHCLFSVERNGLHAVSMEEIALPRTEGIKGISGSGIWKVGRIEGDTLFRFMRDDVELCAIEHTYHEGNGYIIGTWIERVVEGIIDRHPETRKVFEMYPNSPKW